MNTFAEWLSMETARRQRATTIAQLQAGRRHAAQQRLLAGEARPGDLVRAGQEPRFLLRLHHAQLGEEVVAVAEMLINGGCKSTYEELLVVARLVLDPAEV